MLFEGDEVLFPQADVARGRVVLVTADQVVDDGGGRFGVRAMRTSFFAGVPAAGVPAKKSKCALPAPTALLKGLTPGGRCARVAMAATGPAKQAKERYSAPSATVCLGDEPSPKGEATKKKAPRPRGVYSVGEAVVLANLFDGLVQEADPEKGILL